MNNVMNLYTLLEVVKCIESVKAKTNPDLAYTHSSAYLDVYHRVVACAVLTAFRPQPEENFSETGLSEVTSATDYGQEYITGKFSLNFLSISWRRGTRMNRLRMPINGK